MDKIVVATDFSRRAERALFRAAQLAVRHGAALSLLHVIPTLPLEAFKRLLFETPLETEQRLHQLARAKLAALADKVRARYGVTADLHLGVGRVYAEINRHARESGADLVVIGAHGEHFLRDVFLGTTVSKVLDHGRLPLLIVRSGRFEPYCRVLVPVDFSRPSRLALESAMGLAEPEAVYALHAYEVPFDSQMRYAGVSEETMQRYRAQALDEARRQMEAFLAEAGAGAAARVIEQGYAPAVIRDRARALGADLIVIGKRGETELDEELLGSVTKHVLYETGCDLLVVNPAAQD